MILSSKTHLVIRKTTGIILILLLGSFLVYTYWKQQVQYLLPTPVPLNYQKVEIGTFVDTNSLGIAMSNKPSLLHFFNPNCPCSKFNLPHVLKLNKNYGEVVNFIFVVPFDIEDKIIKSYQREGVSCIRDSAKTIATLYGVYSTPQAAIVESNGTLYYRGNYNRSRYCTSPDYNFAEIALDSLLAGNKKPIFDSSASTAYGCAIDAKSTSIINYFNFSSGPLNFTDTQQDR